MWPRAIFAATLACVLLLASGPGLAAGVPASGAIDNSRIIYLTSLEWPPYTGARLPRQGASTAVLAAALASMGYRLEVHYFPWSRATALIRHNSRYAGYFPEYSSPDMRREFLFSDAIGDGPLGLAERADAPIHWETVDQLARYRIGAVSGYVNADEFDRRVREGKQTVDYAPNDKQNLRKLAAGRVPLALVDRRVFDYLTRHDPDVRAVAPALRFNPKLMEIKQLFICLRRTPEGERVRKIFNEGLKRIDIEAVMAAALQPSDIAEKSK